METVKKIQEGDVRTASRLIRRIEDGVLEARSTIKKLFPLTGNAHIVGITGPPGAGKSTLVDGIVTQLRQKQKKVGVLAVDPTSPFTGGAILGDRVRMQKHAEDEGVFVRSLATRCALGGLAKAVGDAIHIMDVMGKEVILVETVGTGQQEVDIINHSHTVLVVLIPGMGDEIQAIKAGIMEIADIFVINKADRDGGSKLYRELVSLLDMAPASAFASGWRPPIVKVENSFVPESFNNSVAELTQKIEEHHQHLLASELMVSRERRKAAVELSEAIRNTVYEPIMDKLITEGTIDAMVEELMAKTSDPYSLAERIAQRFLKS
ncbi:MAG: methylmalonyl Co-A mutase-associated GTPase MeaB [Deltaproteobacteria bacterium]|nr:methylmalonyl Co-A mutase-associated GTPase MeaB [Deltaproteobacteria bacterium]